ncbi:hypothetical protein PIB30_026279 [Stylosanthes scabra]|uniref:Uncharacterized protein n=1 Tax=Stylosanthes scabra TaxID=79078 RepID=A0ABU6TA13_9FABA|nr:hypothetical protein [Stylosanthes scabra]
MDKTGLIFGNAVSVNVRVQMEDFFNIASWDQLGNYLGLPAQWGQSRSTGLKWIEERIEDILNGLKQKMLLLGMEKDIRKAKKSIGIKDCQRGSQDERNRTPCDRTVP